MMQFNTPHHTVKEEPLINEIIESVNSFRTHLSEQKGVRDDLNKISHQSSDQLKKSFRQMHKCTISCTCDLHKLGCQANQLKSEITQDESNVDLLRKCLDTQSGTMNMDSRVPDFFLSTLNQMCLKIPKYREEVEALEELLDPKNAHQIKIKDFIYILRQLDDHFVNIAANVYNLREATRDFENEYLKRVRTTHGESAALNYFALTNTSSSKLEDPINFVSGLSLSNNRQISSRYGPSPFENEVITKSSPSAKIGSKHNFSLGSTQPFTF